MRTRFRAGHGVRSLTLVARSLVPRAVPPCCARSAASRSRSTRPGLCGRPTRPPRGLVARAAPPLPRPSCRSSRRPAACARSTRSRPRRRGWRSRRGAATSGTTAPSTGGRNVFTAFVYREMTPGFAEYEYGRARSPGRCCTAEVGDVLVVHFRNGDTKLRQAVTMHPHGVKYNPEYDGAYMGEFTRAGGFIAPGRVVHLPVGVHARLGRRLAVPRPRPQPHAEHVPRAVRRRSSCARAARSGPTASTRCSPTSSRRR